MWSTASHTRTVTGVAPPEPVAAPVTPAIGAGS